MIVMIEELIHTMAQNLRSAGRVEQADAVEQAGARIRDAVDLPAGELQDELLALRHNASVILQIIDDLAPPASPVTRTERQRRDDHSRRSD